MKKEIEMAVYSCPPTEISKRIDKIRFDISKKFGKNPSLFCVPHITMRSGLIFPKEKLSLIFAEIKKEFLKIKKPHVQINNLGYYEGKNIFCVQLEIKNKKEIEKVYKKLEKLFSEYTRGFILHKFNPHISLYWDYKKNLSKKNIEKIKRYTKDIKFNVQYKMSSLFIYKKVGNKFSLIREIK